MHAREAFHQLSHAPSPLLFVLLGKGLNNSALGWPQTCDPPASAFQVAVITGVHHHTKLSHSKLSGMQNQSRCL
jgi:hypothetical protein